MSVSKIGSFLWSLLKGCFSRIVTLLFCFFQIELPALRSSFSSEGLKEPSGPLWLVVLWTKSNSEWIVQCPILWIIYFLYRLLRVRQTSSIVIKHFDVFYVNLGVLLFNHFIGTFHASNNLTSTICQVVAKQQTHTTGTRPKCSHSRHASHVARVDLKRIVTLTNTMLPHIIG